MGGRVSALSCSRYVDGQAQVGSFYMTMHTAFAWA